jgi:hypothetical protein
MAWTPAIGCVSVEARMAAPRVLCCFAPFGELSPDSHTFAPVT